MNIPVYNAYLKDENDGITAISLVENGAVEVNFQMFEKDKELLQFKVENEEKHILLGCVMRCDFNIYRRTDDGFEYFIRYDRETIEKMSKKMLADGAFANIDLQHNGEILPLGTLELMEVFIKDTNKGICPNGFENVADGSLFCTYKVNDNDLWELCKNGEFHAFSLEGYFTIGKDTFQKVEENKNNKRTYMSKFKELIADLIMKFGSVDTDKGTLIYEGEELAVGASVNGVSGQTVEDGEYTYEDKVITVKDGKVEAISDKEEEVVEETTEETVEETMEEATEETTEEETVEETVEEVTEETPTEVEQLKAEIEVLKSDIEAIKNQLAIIVASPSVEPIAEQYEKVVETKKPNGIKLGVFASL